MITDDTDSDSDESGQVGGIEGVVFGVLVFVLGTLVIANAWAVIDAKMAAGSAAREATRAFVEADASSPAEALVAAESAARDAIAGYGRDPDRMEFTPESAALERCAPVSIRVAYPVPLVIIPILGRYGHGFTAVGRHSEIVDPYRSGLPAGGACPDGLRP